MKSSVISRRSAYAIATVFLVIGLMSGVGIGSTYLSKRTYPTTMNTITTSLTQTYTSSYFVTEMITSTTTSYFAMNVSSTFNGTSAKQFLESLDTPLGLLETFKGSNQIYIADDQALDHAALIKLGNLSLADSINSSMNAYGGLYSYWNAANVVMNIFPPNWNFSFPLDYNLSNVGGYSIMVTRFTQPGTLQDYSSYADLELYYSMYSLHVGNYSQAITAFEVANSMWNGYGFADKAYNSSLTEYDSYKLALDVIVYKALMSNLDTQSKVALYNLTIGEVQGVMSMLQGRDGGVITNYRFVNGTMLIPSNTFENGETTSLFVLAE